MDSWKDSYDPNARYKLGCETDSNWVLRRLNFEQKGTQTQCLNKGYGYGESHSFFWEDKETLDEKQLENLHKVGNPEGLTIITEVAGLGGDLPKDPATPQPLEIPSAFLDRVYKLKQAGENKWTPDVWGVVIEEFQAQVRGRNNVYFCSAKRAPNDNRLAANTVFARREFRFLEESFSLKQTRQAFDATDLQQMFLVRFNTARSHSGRLLFVLPDLTPNLAEIEQQDVVCEVNFETKQIIFYCQIPASYWYARIMMQQFALAGETWRLEMFLVENYETLILVAITRMLNGALNLAALQALDEKEQRILLFLNRLSSGASA